MSPRARPAADHDATAISYLRVSTGRQARRGGEPEGFSIPAQRDYCDAKIDELGATKLAEFIEPGASARSTQRKALQEMLTFIAEHKPTYLVVHKIDRFARDADDAYAISQALRRIGTMLVSVCEPIDDTPQGKFMFNIYSAVAQLYSDNLAAEVAKGTEQKVKRGGTATRAPLGYRNIGKIIDDFEVRTVELDPVRAPLVKWLFEQYATGEHSYQSVAEAAAARGLTTRPTKKRTATPVQAKQAEAMLKNRYYIGYVTWRGVEYQGTHDPLISHDLFERVQGIIDSHRKARISPLKHRHFLAGSLRCGRCGYHLVYNVVTSKGRRYDYFTCARRLNGNRCDLPNLRAEQVETIVEQRWHDEQLSPDELTRLREDASAEIAAAEKRYAAEVKHLAERIAAVRAERVKWAEAAINGTAPADVVRDKQQVLGVQLSALESQRESLATAGSRHRANLDTILRLHTDVVGMYLSGSPLLRRTMNQTWFESLTITEDDGQTSLSRVEYTEPVAALRGLVRSAADADDDPEVEAVSAAETDQMTQVPSQRGDTGSHETATASATRPNTPPHAHQREDAKPTQDESSESAHTVDVSKTRHLVALDLLSRNVRTALDWLRTSQTGRRDATAVPQDNATSRGRQAMTTDRFPFPPANAYSPAATDLAAEPDATSNGHDFTPIDPRTTAQMTGPVRHTVPHRPAKVAAIDVEVLLYRHRDGLTLRQLAAEFGTHRTTISDLLRSVGVETNRFVVPQTTVDQIIRMYRDGASCITIGKRVGRAKSTVRQVLVSNGVRMRDSHGREK